MHAHQQGGAAQAVCRACQCLRPLARQLRQTIGAVGLQQQPDSRDLRANVKRFLVQCFSTSATPGHAGRANTWLR